jgi:type IV pilus assembly protein PilB
MDADADERIIKAKAHQFGMEYVGPRLIDAGRHLAGLMPETLARACNALPQGIRGECLTVLMSEPNDFEAVDRLRFELGRPIDVALASSTSIRQAIERIYGTSRL